MYKPMEVARKAYETYTRSTVNQDHAGNQHPRWEDLPELQHQAWLGVVQEVTELVNPVESRAHATKKSDDEKKPLHKHAHAAH